MMKKKYISLFLIGIIMLSGCGNKEKVLTCTKVDRFDIEVLNDTLVYKFNDNGTKLKKYNYTQKSTLTEQDPSYYNGYETVCDVYKNIDGVNCYYEKSADSFIVTLEYNYDKIDFDKIEDENIHADILYPDVFYHKTGFDVDATNIDYDTLVNYYKTRCDGYDTCVEYICKKTNYKIISFFYL